MNDIAIIKLKASMKFSNGTGPIKIIEWQIVERDKLTLSGWTSNANNMEKDLLLYIDNFQLDAKCTGYDDGLTADSLCAKSISKLFFQSWTLTSLLFLHSWLCVYNRSKFDWLRKRWGQLVGFTQRRLSWYLLLWPWCLPQWCRKRFCWCILSSWMDFGRTARTFLWLWLKYHVR